MNFGASNTHASGFFRALGAVLRKEWQDAWSDRRGTQSAFMYALLGPLLLYVTLSTLVEQASTQKAIPIAVVGSEQWPELTAQLSAPRLSWENLSVEAAEAALRARKVDAVLTLGTDTAERLQRYEALRLQLHHRSDSESESAAQLLRRQIATLQQQLTRARLLARGMAPQHTSPIDLSVHTVDGRGGRSQMLGLLAILLLLGAFFASMNVAIDATAGERERESLEVLLSQPPSSFTLVLGKYLVVLVFALLGSLLTIIAARLLLGQLALYEIPLRIALEPRVWAQLLLISLPFAMLMSALQMAFALLAKNYKEAQIYLTLLAFVPTMLSMPLADKLPAYWPIPVLGEHRMMQDALRGEVVAWLPGVWLLLVATALALLGLWFCARSLKQERMLRAA